MISFKRSKIPRLTAKIKENRLKFAESRKEWTFEDWKRVLWSDEAPSQLFNIPNRQNDRVWDRNSAEVIALSKSRKSPKLGDFFEIRISKIIFQN